jgi:predicted ester cyclase
MSTQLELSTVGCLLAAATLLAEDAPYAECRYLRAAGQVKRGEWFGIPPTGRAIRIEVFDICRIVGSQVTEHWGFADNIGVMRQLGVLPAPGN